MDETNYLNLFQCFGVLILAWAIMVFIFPGKE